MVKIIVQWSLVISLGVAGLRTYLTIWVNCTFIWENIRIQGSKCYLLLRHTELKRLISTGFGTSLIQIKKLCIVFRNSQNRDAQMLFARIPKSVKKLAKRWGRQRKRKRGKTDCLLNRQRKLRIRCFLKIPFQILLYLSP